MNSLTPALSLAPRTFDEALRFADLVAQSDLAPKDYKGKPGNVLVAVQMGAEVGLSPMQAIQNIAVINGRPSIWGDAALALVKASPVCIDVIETMRGEGDEMVATCIAKRKGAVDVSRSFSVADAKKAGLWGKTGRDGQPTPWVTYPTRMLQQRARGFAIRDAFPDLLKGLVTREEAEDVPREMVDVTPPHDAETGELPDSRKLFADGKIAAEKGKDALQAWWKTLAAHERKALGGLTGSPMAQWKQMATVADNKSLETNMKQASAKEGQEPPAAAAPGDAGAQAEPQQQNVFHLPISDDEAFCDARLAEVKACKTYAELDAIKATWAAPDALHEKGVWYDRMERIPANDWGNLMRQIGDHEKSLTQ
jgi:hypothetical protein